MPLLLHQRIYDNGLGQYVIYAKYEVDTSPAASETTPNYTGSLVTASHEVYDVQYVDPMFHESDSDTVGLWNLNGDLAAETGSNLALSTGLELYTTAPFIQDQGFWFNGSTRLGVTDAALRLAADMTVMFVVNMSRVESSGKALAGVAGAGATTAENIQWYVEIDAGNRLAWIQENGGGNVGYTSDVGVPVGQPVHVAISRDSAGTGLTFYLQGEERDTTVLSGAPTGGSSASFFLGGWVGGGFNIQGMISSFIVKDVEMGADDIREAALRTLQESVAA